MEDYYQELERLKLPEADVETLSRLVDEHPGMTLAELRAAASEVSADHINLAIASHRLYVDLATHRLSEPGRTPVFCSRELARAYRHRGNGADEVGMEAHLVDIVQGTTILWDGRAYRLAVGQTELTLISEEGQPFPLLRSAFEALVKDGKIVGVQTETHSSITLEGQELLDKARELDMATATFRNRVINPDQYDDEEQAQITARAAAIPARTRRDWKHAYRVAEITYGSGLIGLLPGYVNCGGKRKVATEVIALMEEVLESHYDTVTRKPKGGAYGEYLQQSEERGLATVSQRTFSEQALRHKTMYEQVLAREGARAAYPFKDYHHPREKTISRHGDYAWAMGHLDHLEVALELRDSKTDQPMGKCWLTLLILAHPRRIAAYYLSFDPPSYRSCMMALRLCVKRFGRLPTAITVDGGSEFHSIYFEQLLALYKVRKHQRPAAEPRFGSPLERLFGTMETEFIHHLLGNTQASQTPRTTTKATDPRRHAVWTLAALAERMRVWADEEYDTLRHPALGQSPREAYKQSLQRDGERDHKRIPYDEVFKRAAFPTTDRGQGLVQPGKGVRMNYLDYWCDEMRDRDVERTYVKVRYDPFDVTIAYAFVRGQWRKCVCAADELAGCSERELQILAEELRKRNRLQYGREQVEITQKQLALFRRENAAMEVLLRQQRNDRETRAAFLVLEGGRGTRTAPSPATSPAQLSQVLEKDAHDQTNEPAPRRPRQAVGDGDNLIVLRRVRS